MVGRYAARFAQLTLTRQTIGEICGEMAVPDAVRSGDGRQFRCSVHTRFDTYDLYNANRPGRPFRAYQAAGL